MMLTIVVTTFVVLMAFGGLLSGGARFIRTSKVFKTPPRKW